MNGILVDSGFTDRHRQRPEDFSRKPILNVQWLVMLLLNQLKGSLQDEMEQFFMALSPSYHVKRVLTNAALSKARKKLKASAFVELNEGVLKIFYEEFPGQKRWHGFHLVGVDGSKIELPSDPEIEDKFGVHCQSGRPMGLLSTLYDLNHRLWLDAELVPTSVNEREIATSHLKKITEDQLAIYDRGYAAFWFLALHRDAGRQFCMRLQRSLFSQTDAFFNSDATEAIVTIKASKKRRQQCRKYGASSAPITLRLIRVELDSGEVEVLAVSLLDSKRFPANIFGDLYRQRWGHEEGYKRLKLPGELQNWSGKKLHTVYQDLHAKLLTLNLATMHELGAQGEVDQKTANRKRRYQVNRTQALSQMKGMIIKLICSLNPLRLIRQLAEKIARNINAVRPNRRYPRKPRPGTGTRVRQSYKRVR